jgi:small subunit ribosomal protein S4
MKRIRKKYESPTKPFDKQRIEKEREILKNFGLRRKREIWRTEALLRKYRRMARNLIAKRDKEQEKILIGKLVKLGVLQENSGLDDVLGMTIENLLERRLQTIVCRKGFANSMKQSRQLIVHGHVTVGGRRIVHPGYLVPKNEEDEIQVKILPAKKEMVRESGGTS